MRVGGAHFRHQAKGKRRRATLLSQELAADAQQQERAGGRGHGTAHHRRRRVRSVRRWVGSRKAKRNTRALRAHAPLSFIPVNGFVPSAPPAIQRHATFECAAHAIPSVRNPVQVPIRIFDRTVRRLPRLTPFP